MFAPGPAGFHVGPSKLSARIGCQRASRRPCAMTTSMVRISVPDALFFYRASARAHRLGAAPPQYWRLRARSSRCPLLLASRVVCDDVSVARGALDSESEDSCVCVLRGTAAAGYSQQVDVGSISALLHAPRTGRCRPGGPGLHAHHFHIDRIMMSLLKQRQPFEDGGFSPAGPGDPGPGPALSGCSRRVPAQPSEPC